MGVAEPIFAPWKADLSLGFRYENDRTVLAEKCFSGPLVVQKPLYPEGDDVCHAIVVHPPAGIVGGDQLSVHVRAAPQSSVLMTTPGAGKWYRSAGPWASQKLRFDVSGSLEWLPQETIVFDGALADIACEVNLGDGRELHRMGNPVSRPRRFGRALRQGQDRAAKQDLQKRTTALARTRRHRCERTPDARARGAWRKVSMCDIDRGRTRNKSQRRHRVPRN